MAKLAIVGLLAFICLGLPVDPSHAVFAGENGSIAFTRFENDSSAIYIMEANGSNPHSLPTGMQAADPAWSPDGSRLAFTASNKIWVVDATGGDAVQVSPIPGRHAAWSPDGRLIAFSGVRENESAGVLGFNQDIYTVSVNGTGLQRLTTDPASDEHPSWSPDGNYIAYNSWPDQIIVMDSDGANPHEIATLGSVDIGNPDWSPDGARIVFDGGHQGESNEFLAGIYVVDATGENQQRLTESLDYNPRWSPDGTMIAFSRGVNDSQIWIMKANGTEQTPITQGSGVYDGTPSWQRLLPNGDANCSGVVDVGDALAILSAVATEQSTCSDYSANANCDSAVDVRDALAILLSEAEISPLPC